MGETATDVAAEMASAGGGGGPRAGSSGVRLSGLRKRYGSLAAVDGVDLEIAQGEFFTMLGPSGSGKTTLLRMIAGFERPDAGTIELGGVDVTRHAALWRATSTRSSRTTRCSRT